MHGIFCIPRSLMQLFSIHINCSKQMTLMTFSYKMCPKKDFLRSVLFRYKVTFIIILLDFQPCLNIIKLNLWLFLLFLVDYQRLIFTLASQHFRIIWFSYYLPIFQLLFLLYMYECEWKWEVRLEGNLTEEGFFFWDRISYCPGNNQVG